MAWDNLISRTLWVLLQPGNALFIMLLLGLFLVWRSGLRSRWRRSGKRLVVCSSALILIFGFTEASTWLTVPLEKRFVPYRNKIDAGPYGGIIVLAGSEKPSQSTVHNQAILKEYGERLVEAAKLARLFPDLPLIHAGGMGSEGEWTESDVARKFFEDAGIDLSRIQFEGRSYNTYTNAIETRKLIPQNDKRPWLLVTSAFHMPRSVGSFRKAGINIQPYPVDYMTRLEVGDIFYFNLADNLKQLNLAAHEWLGLLVYYIAGRSDRLYPAP